MVRWPERDLWSAAAMTSLISLMPVRTALKETNSELVRRAIRRASVVFPQPGGPQKSMEPRLSFSICTRSDLPGPRSFSWPMNSSRVRGRMRSASGWLAAGTSGSRAAGPCGVNGNLEKRLTLFLDVRRGHGVSLTGGFVKNDGGRGGGVQGLDAASHGNAEARVGAALDFFGEASAFVADEEGDRLAPVDFPGSEEGWCGIARRGRAKARPYNFCAMGAGSESANARDFELREENRKGHAGEDREMQGSASGGAESLRRERVGGAADAGSGGGGAGCAKGGCCAQDGGDVAGVLDAGKNDKQGSASRKGSAHEIVEGSFAWMDQRGDALRMLGVGEALEEAVGGAQDGKSHFGAVDEGGESFMMALAGFAEEHGLNAASGTQCFFDEPDALDADEAAFRGKAAAESHAELLEPAIVAAAEERGRTFGSRVTSVFSWRSHYRGG